MEAGTRQLGLGPQTKRRVLILAAAIAMTAVSFGLLFEAAAHLTAWVLGPGMERFEKIHPLARGLISVGPGFLLMASASAVALKKRRQRMRRIPVRRTRGAPRTIVPL